MKSTSKDIVSERQKTSIALCVMISLFWASLDHSLLAQSSTYKIQTGDHLKITFWENPELNTLVAVGKDGEIVLPVIGKLTAGGLTIAQLREKVISQITLYNKVINQVDITVVEYGSNRVFVSGQIGAPGKYSFEEIPGLWNIILEAGGPLETALLDEVVIARSEEDGRIFTVNLSDALRYGRLSELPLIRPGDTIHVPGVTQSGNSSSPLINKNNIYVLGAVATPGSYRFEKGSNLLEVISKAGGALPDADLRKVSHISVSFGMTVVAEVDLERYLRRSIPNPMPIGAGDTVVIPKKRGLSALLKTIITASITTAMTTAILIFARKQ